MRMRMRHLMLVLICLIAPPLAQAKPRPAGAIQTPGMRIFAQTGSPCGTGVAHCTTLSWTASSSAASCTSPCTFGYNVFRGTAPGGESTTPLNATPISGASYVDPVTLTSNQQTFYYTIEAVETSGGVTASSAPSAEVSDTFPGIPAAPVVGSAIAH